jgi:hypothetical protein
MEDDVRRAARRRLDSSLEALQVLGSDIEIQRWRPVVHRSAGGGRSEDASGNNELVGTERRNQTGQHKKGTTLGPSANECREFVEWRR